MKCKSVYVVGIVMFMVGCSAGNNGDWKAHNLLRYDLPISIMAPDSVIVTSDNLLFTKDVTVKGALEEGYNVQIFSSEASTLDPKVIKTQQLADVKTNPYFKELIKDEDQGFIYRTEIDSVNINYGFKWIKVQGDNEFVFQNGIGRFFTLEEVEKMYDACKGPKK
ncbi:MAG: hypothetical protein KJP00_08705 [Bacteroidia bacterium]|nr:hypothetical protein [Bacteroidia bacterium]